VGLGGDDIIDGEHGGDVLLGGGGADALRAGPGRETLIDSGGTTSLIGGTGNDTLISRGGNALEEGGSANNTLEVDRGHAQVFGGPRSNTFVVRGGSSSLIPGPGGDTFKLLGGHADIVERHRNPRDRLISAISTTMPFGVDQARLIGHRALRLIGNGEGDLIIGNSGNDYLTGGGSGVSRIKAGAGRNTLVVGREDTVSAGRGADRYVPNGDTGLIRATSIPAPPRPRARFALSAGVIQNFSSAKGDRIVLQAQRLGLEIRQLARHFRLVQGVRPRLVGRRPTLVYYPRSHLLAYAVNGAGGYPLRPLAILRGVRSLKRSDFVIK
jgi:Ca2+-binding RTX toxin-like protein